MDQKVAIIGLGYVGLPLAIAAAQSGYLVSGVDTDHSKLADPTYQFSAALSLVNIGKLSGSNVPINNLNNSDPRDLEYLNWFAKYEDEISKNYSESIRIRNLIAVFHPWDPLNDLEMGKMYKRNSNLAGMNKMPEKILSFAPDDDIARVAKQELA